jgi:hypothetical protein
VCCCANTESGQAWTLHVESAARFCEAACFAGHPWHRDYHPFLALLLVPAADVSAAWNEVLPSNAMAPANSSAEWQSAAADGDEADDEAIDACVGPVWCVCVCDGADGGEAGGGSAQGLRGCSQREPLRGLRLKATLGGQGRADSSKQLVWQPFPSSCECVPAKDSKKSYYHTGIQYQNDPE